MPPPPASTDATAPGDGHPAPSQSELPLDAATALPPVLALHLFGPMRIVVAGVPVAPKTRKTRALLAVLAAQAPRPVLRTQLIALLWSTRAPDQARASLRQALHELQSVLGPLAARLLRVGRAELALDPAGLWRDSAALDAPGGLAGFALPLLADLRGIDPAFDAWIGAEERRLVARARAAIAHALEREEIPAAIEAAETLLAADPADAAAWDLLGRAHRAAGDPAAAEATEARRAAALGGPPPAAAPPPTHAAWLGASTAAGLRVGVIGLYAMPGAAPEALALAAGLSSELIAALARFRGIACIPLAALPPHPAEAGLDFLLDGAVQAAGEQLRVSIRLLDLAAGGEVAWAERFDRPLTNLFALQDELAGETVARLESRLLLWRARRAGGPRDPQAERLLRAALPGLLRLDRAGFARAGEYLQAARVRDPDHPGVHAWLAHWHLFAVGQGWASDPAGAGAALLAHAETAVGLDPEDARALSLSAHVQGFALHDAAAATHRHEQALAANPNLPLGWALSGLNEAYLGRAEEAARRTGLAARLSPRDPLRYFFDMAQAVPHFLRGEDEAAVRLGQAAIAANPGFSSSYKTQLAALGHLGRREEAAAVRARLLALEPGFSVAEALERSPIVDAAGRARYREGLRLGGLE
ncbi:MAG: hypothetical protein ACP5NP_14370 [Acetobacteraceae bacterium]